MKELTVIIASYKPLYEKLLFTIESVLKQQNIDFELIITDDGSEYNYFDEIEKYIKANSNCDLVLLSHNKNQGTVKNIYDAVRIAKGKYVRTIGVGDAIYGENTLKAHLDCIKSSNNLWSFGQMIYFSVDENGNRFFVKHKSRPQLTKPYINRNDKKCIWQYCVLKDIATGTSILYERETFAKYLSLFLDKVIYCEDYVTEIMMFDGIMPTYYASPVVLYEYASGGITNPQEKKWKVLIEKDIATADGIMISRNNFPQDAYRRSIIRAITRRNKLGRKKIAVLFEPSKLFYAIRHRMFPQYTEIPEDISCLTNSKNK